MFISCMNHSQMKGFGSLNILGLIGIKALRQRNNILPPNEIATQKVVNAICLHLVRGSDNVMQFLVDKWEAKAWRSEANHVKMFFFLLPLRSFNIYLTLLGETTFSLFSVHYCA